MKCSACKHEFDEDGFKCCPSCRERARNYARSHPISAEYRREWRKAHPKPKKPRPRKYPGLTHNEVCKLWRHTHPDEWRAARDGWKQRNPHKLKEYRQTRKYRERGALCDCQDQKYCRTQIAEWYRKAFVCTEATGQRHEVNHIVPISKGGKHCHLNIQILTARENRLKAANTAG